MFTKRLRHVHVLAGIVAITIVSAEANAGVLLTDFSRSTEAIIEVAGIRVDGQSQTTANGPAESTVTLGSFNTLTEARASGRSLQLSMTSNAEYDIRDPSFQNPTDFSGVRSQAEILLSGVSIGGDLSIEFFLPPGFLEIRTQGEALGPPFIQEAHLNALLTFSSPTITDGFAKVFQFDASLSGDFFNSEIVTSANSGTFGSFPFGGPPSPLDLSPLTHTNLSVMQSTDAQGIPLKTILWEYPAFSATVNIGAIPAGQVFTLEYELNTEVIGNVPISGAAAAINDPLNLTQFGPPVISQVGAGGPQGQVPEPSGMILWSAATLCVGCCRRRRKTGAGEKALSWTTEAVLHLSVPIKLLLDVHYASNCEAG